MKPMMKLFAVLAASALIAGCGGEGTNGIDKMSPEDALAKVKSDVKSVTSVHVRGNLAQGGIEVGLDVHAADGEGEGTLSVGDGTVEIRLLDGTAYLRGDETALRAFSLPEAEIAATAGKWLKSPAAGGAFASFTTFLDLGNLFDQLLQPGGTLKIGSTTTVNGEKAVALVREGSQGGTLYVAATGRALPLRVAKTGGSGGHVDFLDYDEDVEVEAPEGALDLSQVGG